MQDAHRMRLRRRHIHPLRTGLQVVAVVQAEREASDAVSDAVWAAAQLLRARVLAEVEAKVHERA